MDKISDFIPLIVIIASIVFSIAGSSWKKKTQVSGKMELPKWAQDQTKQVQKKKEPVLGLVDGDRKQQGTEGVTVFSRDLPYKGQTIELEEDESTPIINILDMDEIKRAIVYSEIFQRKNY